MASNFADLFEHAVDAMPDRVALIEGERRITFRELDVRSNRLAWYLVSIGAGTGTHIGFQMHNTIETMEVLIACFKVRAVPININYRYGAEELRYVYDNADLEILVHHERYRAVVDQARGPKLRHTVVVADGGSGEIPSDSRSSLYHEAVQGFSNDRLEIERSSDDLFVIYTGGTTGLPKGVIWRQEDVWRVLGGGIDFYTGEPVADEYQQSRVGAESEPLLWLVLPPLIHTAALMPTFHALWAGNSVGLLPAFDAEAVWRTVERERPGVLVITGDAMARPLLDYYEAHTVDASSLIVIASGAALLSQPVKNRLLELFPNRIISDSIGSSETGFGGMGFAEKDDDPARGPQVQTGRGAIVVDDDGIPVDIGGEGWLAKTGAVPLGYYNDQARTDRLFRVVDGTRMVITDDRARVEPNGVITLIGRGNMVINTGGEKVFAEEVESVVKAAEGIYDAVVIGVPHERWGHQVVAVVSVVDGTEPDFAGLERHVRDHLASYKLPRRIWVTDVVTRTPSGKPDYRAAQAHVEAREPDHEVGRSQSGAR